MSSFSLKKILKMLPLRHDKFGRGSGDRKEGERKQGEGPPDLDELWKRFNERLGKIFKRKNKDDGSEPDNEGDDENSDKTPDHIKGIRFGIGAVAVVAFFFWLITGFFIVQEGEAGVVMTFGRYSHTEPSGINWRKPYPIQSHEVVNISQVRTIEVGYRSTLKNKQPKEALMLTNDENIVDIQFAVQYRLKSAADWVFNNRNQEDMVRQVAEAAIREVVGKNKMDFVLYEGRDKIAYDTNKLMQEIFDQYQAGVQITNVTMQGVQPPEQVQAAFDDAVKAGQDRERQKNEGEAYANDVIPKARGAAARLLQEAEGYRERIVANAEGDAGRFKQVLAEYQKAPAVTRDRMYLETMQQIFSNTTKLLMDAKSGNNLLYLPLDKLISKEGVTPEKSTTAQSGAPGTASQITEDNANRARESRDRGVR